MQTVLFELGLVLFLLGLLTGFAVPALKNPRMALSSHLEAILNGIFLVLLGLLWPHVDLPRAGCYRGRADRLLRLRELGGGAARRGVGRRPQTRAHRGGRPPGLGDERGDRQRSVGEPVAVDGGRRGHRHRRALITSPISPCTGVSSQACSRSSAVRRRR
jgi:hypothetical protein